MNPHSEQWKLRSYCRGFNKPFKPSAYKHNKKSFDDSVAGSIAQFHETIKDPPNLGEQNTALYRRFCTLMREPEYRYSVYGRSGLRYRR